MCCADGARAASTNDIFSVIQQNQCTHLGVFAVAAGQALEQRIVGLHPVGW